MNVLIMRFRSTKSEEELRSISEASLPVFRTVPGLIQKYFVRNAESDEVAGIYVWESESDREAYVNGPIAAAVPQKFDVIGEVRYERFTVEYAVHETVAAA